MGYAVACLLFLILCWPSPHANLSYATVYYVTPHHSPNPDCPPGEPCLTINECAQGNHFDGDDNITLLFLSGEHTLTAQSFEVVNKTLLKMAPTPVPDDEASVVIQLKNGTNMIVSNLVEVELTGLTFIALNDSTQMGTLFSNIAFLSITNVRIESYQLSIHGEVEVTVTELTVKRSTVNLLLSHGHHTVAIKNSNFYFSTLNISDSINGLNDTVNAISLESNSMNTSLVSVNLHNQITCKLSLLNSNISSERISSSLSDTGVVASLSKSAKLVTLIKNCTINGNYYGVKIEGQKDVTVKLTIDDCFITNNGFRNSSADYGNETHGGIDISNSGETFTDQNQMIDVKIISTTLRGNERSQLSIRRIARTTNVSVFDSKIQGTQISVLQNMSCDQSAPVGGGAYFTHRFGSINPSALLIINFTRCAIEKNGIGVHMDSINSHYEVYFDNNNVTGHNGFGFLVFTQSTSNNYSHQVSISNSLFAYNSHTTICIRVHFARINIIETNISESENGLIVAPGNLRHQVSQLIVRIEKSQIHENRGVSVGLTSLRRFSETATNITLQSVTFFNNINTLPDSGIVRVDGTVHLSVENLCEFKGNHGSSIYAFRTTVTLSGEILFQDNRAFEGGAISLSYSKLTLESRYKSNTNISFVNNTAERVGGGIFVDQSLNIDADTESSCFYDLQGVSQDEITSNNVSITMSFRDNNATTGGTDIYGATPNSACEFYYTELEGSSSIGFSIVSSAVYRHVFSGASTNFSSVASDPRRVCLCDSASQLMCANLSHIFYNTTRYPGETFSLNVAVVGLGFGTVAGFVKAKLQSQTSEAFLGRDQYVRRIGYNGCSSLDFTVNSHNLTETIVLTTQITRLTLTDNQRQISHLIDEFNNDQHNMIPSFLSSIPVHIDVSLKQNCPSGFILTNQKCDCSNQLEQIRIYDCVVNDSIPYITRNKSQWVKQVLNPDGILSSRFCPNSYCVQGAITIDLNDPDKLCAFNRTGILCGGCPQNLSLAIGSSRCLKCSNNYGLSLMIAFAAAGIVLVLFIKILDLTVSKGTINGLIFYANIVWTNQNALLPQSDETSLYFLRVFIAWLNLDLGIETCFIKHLDGYSKTWLQFAFPTYIFLIAILVIIFSHYSTRATKIIGNNSISVLATLVFISYAKLLRTILIVLQFIRLTSPNGQRFVWAFDGNVEYLNSKHSVLFLLAILILLVGLPYTFLLLFSQCLRRYSDYRLLRWVNKLHPLFDSYLGPLKDRHQYWIGLGLFARFVLLQISSVTLTIDPAANTVVITAVASSFSLIAVGVYKQWQLGVLEGCFLVNLIVFINSVAEWPGQKDNLATSSLGIAFILFLGIIAYHLWQICSSLTKKYRRKEGCSSDMIQAKVTHKNIQVANTFQDMSLSTFNFREPLIETTVN